MDSKEGKFKTAASSPFLKGSEKVVMLNSGQSEKNICNNNNVKHNYSEARFPPPMKTSLTSASIYSSTFAIDLFIQPQPGRAEEIDEEDPGIVVGRTDKTSLPLWKRYLGVLYTILAVNCLALTNTIMKKYSHIHPFSVGIWYAPTASLVALSCIFYSKCVEKESVLKGLFPLRQNWKNALLVCIRAVVTSAIFYLSIAAYRYITAADLRTVVSSVVIATFVFGWLFLGEKCGVVPVITAAVAVCGIGIMTRPPFLTGENFDTNTVIGIGIACATMITVALQLIIIRSLGQVHHGVANLFAVVWSAIQGFILCWIVDALELPPLGDILGLSLAGVCFGFALTFLVLALQLEEAGVVALVRTSEVVFIFFWQWVVVGTLPDYISIIGAAFVLSGVISVTLRKWVEMLPKGNATRKRLRFLLL